MSSTRPRSSDPVFFDTRRRRMALFHAPGRLSVEHRRRERDLERRRDIRRIIQTERQEAKPEPRLGAASVPVESLDQRSQTFLGIPVFARLEVIRLDERGRALGVASCGLPPSRG